MITMSLSAQMNPSFLKEKLPTDSSVGKESACNTGELSLIPVLGRSPGEGKVYPLQYSGLENSMHCIVHGVTKSQIQLRNFHFHFHIYMKYVYIYVYICIHVCTSVYTYIYLPKYLMWINHHSSPVKEIWYYFLCISGEIKAIRNTRKLFMTCPQISVVATMGIGISKSGGNTISSLDCSVTCAN